MIFFTCTPHCAGVSLSGDFKDFEELYESLHEVVGDEEEHPSYEPLRIRVLSVCYDLRHALMGHREIEFVENGIDAEKQKYLSVLAPAQNVYLSFPVLWPETIFVAMALNDFLSLYARKRKHIGWDGAASAVRKMQAAFAACVKKTIPDASFQRMLSLMNRDYAWMDGYVTQYVDLLNIKFLAMDREKRLKNIPIMAKRLAEQGDEYQNLRRQVMDAAARHHCSMDDIGFGKEYPEEIDW